MNSKMGTVTREADGFKVRFERVFAHSVGRVWDAITDPEKLKYWFTDIDLELKAGGLITFYYRDEARTSSNGKVILVDKPKRFVWMWETEQAEWELFSEGPDKCRMVFTYSKLDEKYAEKATAGFHLLLDRLAKALEGNKTIYPFGAEESNPEFNPILQQYENALFAEFPELMRLKPIVVEKTIKASADRVWRAITDRDEMKQWYFELSEFRAETGFEFSFYGKGKKGERYLHLCKVTEVVPLKKLAYTWKYEGYPGESLVTFELSPDGNGTKVKLTHDGLASFPADNPDFARTSFNGGWTQLIGKQLPEFVEK
jgi:uncharacterized protein YndB with AHSA1/START domain